MKIKFTVLGTPVPQGSKRAFFIKKLKRAVITEDNKRVKPWRADVKAAAALAMSSAGAPVTQGPVEVQVRFLFDRPKSLKKSVRYKVTKPDIEKLERALNDALTGVVFQDDSQVVHMDSVKDFAEDLRPRAEVAITFLDAGSLFR